MSAASHAASDRARRARRRRRCVRCGRRPRTTCRPPTTTSVTSPAVAANTTAASGVVGASRRRCAANAGRRSTRSAGAPTAIRPASGQPRLRCPSDGGGDAADRVTRWVPRHPDAEPLVELDRPRLLEQVDHRVRVGPEAHRHARVAEPCRRADRRRRGRARSSGTCTRVLPRSPAASRRDRSRASRARR